MVSDCAERLQRRDGGKDAFLGRISGEALHQTLPAIRRNIAIRTYVLQNHPMQHCHLNHNAYTLAAIDDVITRGTLPDWHALRDACKADVVIQQKIWQICAAYVNDRTAQRHAFWAMYVRHQTA